MVIESLCVLRQRGSVPSWPLVGMAFKRSFGSLEVLTRSPYVVLAFPDATKDELCQIPDVSNFRTLDSVKG